MHLLKLNKCAKKNRRVCFSEILVELLLLISQWNIHYAHYFFTFNGTVFFLVNLLKILLTIAFAYWNNQSSTRF